MMQSKLLELCKFSKDGKCIYLSECDIDCNGTNEEQQTCSLYGGR